MRRKFLNFAAATATVLASVTPLTTASAANPVIDQAKATCAIGERNDGYLGAVPGSAVSSAERREMNSVNQQRKAVYERLAERNGVTIEVTATLTAEKLINQAPSGHCVQDGSGTWIKKA